ncbi:GtrA family protein [Bifidobacterium sp. ESL0775]|uniref:GtrA family protein n=1 Tax=Bifidobacterium sp. ESL0775 TaxID=2983230 RepID=UPI0023F691B6|nr:GtrA family protein [Bifidobacterium sp. ESL0775]WEV69350.1 GtrA family protein [Bifidobacterium sp. ESL0775]
MSKQSAQTSIDEPTPDVSSQPGTVQDGAGDVAENSKPDATVEGKGFIAACKRLINKYPNLWEFIKFNVLSNISTITRFVAVWILTALFVHAMHLTQPFSFLIFNYSKPSTNGLGGFLTFLIAEICAQAVNFVVQMKWVFKSDASFKSAAWKYAILAIIIVVCGLLLPGYITTLCKGFGWNDAISSTLASVVNTLLAVIISYPLLKWWIAPAKKGDKAEKK